MADDYFWKTSTIRKGPFEWWDVDKTVCDIDRFPPPTEEDIRKIVKEIKDYMLEQNQKVAEEKTASDEHCLDRAFNI